MLRIIVATCLCLSLMASLRADEVCVACEKPGATYRCTFEEPTRNRKFQIGELVQGEICPKVLAMQGPHAGCKILPAAAEPCDGVARTVTLTDYQRLLAGDGESTYQPGVLEIARRNVYATWVCVTTLFNDC
jgi:hypothetical protein